MMKSGVSGLSGNRSISNSQESNKMKKSITTTLSNSLKGKASSSPNNMIYSIKQNRLNNSSNSNKKITNQSSQSNKSFKTLTETPSHPNIDTYKKTNLHKMDHLAPNNDRKYTVPVKNIKQRIVGKGINQSTIHQTYKVTAKHIAEKENEGEFLKKSKMVEKNMYKPDGEKKTLIRNTTQICEESIIDFRALMSQKSQQLNLGRFEVGRKLGKGRFGDVYMCRQMETGFVCAIKMISKRQVKESGMQSQLLQQIKIQTFCNHPNILKMYGYFHDENKIYLLLELAVNGCLFKQIRQKNSFTENIASFYFRQVVSGIRYLHNNFVIHRDIKPENILNSFSVLKICDFGWAIYSPIYQRQTFCGTLDYVPPEIVTGDFYDQKADVWCLGVLCYQLCTGKAPFESKTNQNQTYNKILKVEIEFPIYLSPQIVDFIGRILNRDPARRLNVQEIECHEWMKKYENEAGRMISKQIWDTWMRLAR